jgi:menaquinone-dependent protoporphyrinogen IX oxidase
MNGIVIYKSRYGAAKQYAQWIGETLKVSVKEMDEVSSESLVTYDYVIAGSSIYMGKILMKGWLAKNANALKGKKLFLFIVGAAPPSEKEKTEKYFTDNISKDLLLQSKHYYLQGKSVFQELSWFDRFFLKMGASLAKDERDKKAMLTDFNAIRKENLSDLLKEVAVN